MKYMKNIARNKRRSSHWEGTRLKKYCSKCETTTCGRELSCEICGWKMLHHQWGLFFLLLSDWNSAVSDIGACAAFISFQTSECGFLGWQLSEKLYSCTWLSTWDTRVKGGRDRMKFSETGLYNASVREKALLNSKYCTVCSIFEHFYSYTYI